MNKYVALLRAVNVGGTGKLPMAELRAMCTEIGFQKVKTYIASGNVLFLSPLTAVQAKNDLEQRLFQYAEKQIDVLMRTADEMTEVLASNPFSSAAPNRTVAIFLNGPPPDDTLNSIKGIKNEEIQLGKQEIYVHYGEGMSNSKLKIPAAASGTARNMNTISKLCDMLANL